MALMVDENEIIELSPSEREIMEFLWKEKDGLSFREIKNLVNQNNGKAERNQDKRHAYIGIPEDPLSAHDL